MMFRHLRFPEGGYSSESGSPPTVPRRRARLTSLVSFFFLICGTWGSTPPPYALQLESACQEKLRLLNVNNKYE